MISVIITSYKEPKTIGRAIEAVSSSVPPASEIIVVAPDRETLEEAEKFTKKYPNLRVLKDAGRGKPAALNLVMTKVRGEILVLTDGDVYLGRGAVKKLIAPFSDKNVGASCGRPISTDSRNARYGFWARVLTEVAHERRLKSAKAGNQFFCSGYLFAIRKKLFPKLPENLLSEDGYISNNVYKEGFKIAYAPEAEVYVKYPNNFKDWINQKKRSAGGYNQIRKMTGNDMRSFTSESLGAFQLLKYVHTLRECFWLGMLYFARLYLWAVIYLDVNLRKKSQKELWVRVGSTK